MDFSRVRPPPAGVSVPRHVLEALRRLDPRLDVQWCYQQRRWKIVEWVGGKFRRWMTAFYWTGPMGQFRAVESAEPICKKLAEVDFGRFGKSGWKGAIDGEIDSRRKAYVENRKAGIAEATTEHVKDMAERSLGVRQTFGQGKIRSRRFVEQGSETLDNFWRDRSAELAQVQRSLQEQSKVTTDGSPPG